ncbi:MAG: rod shape-determining protein MreC [Parvularculaceae bacterium]|nr:rod shape-determining protein MreC [Parvularculaceae bacterium]
MDIIGADRRDAIGRKSGSNVSLLLLGLTSLILLLSSLYAAEATVFRKARETVMEATSPVLAVFSGPIAWVQDRIGAVGDYFSVLEQNKALREENALLRQWEEEARSLRTIVATFEALEGYKAPPEAKPINAFVIGESNDAFAQSMIVNAGARDGVRRGQAVVDDLGIVGRIADVSNNAARILLLNDVQSRIPVFVEGSYVEGLLVGRSTVRPAISITMLADADKIELGQRVVTSGAGGVLPRGLTVGVVSKIDDDNVIVDLTADYARTRMVRIINYRFPTVNSEEIVVTPEATPEPAAGPQAQPQQPSPPAPRAEAEPAPTVSSIVTMSEPAPPPEAAPDEGD